MARHRTAPYGLRGFSPRPGAAQDRALRTKGHLHRSAGETCPSPNGPFSPSREGPAITNRRGFPSLSTDRHKKQPKPRAAAISFSDRSTAQHRTAPYGLRHLFTVARGPVRRETAPFTVARGPGDRESPRVPLAIVRTTRTPPFTVARRPVPRDPP